MASASIAHAATVVNVNFGAAKVEAELVGPGGGSGERWNQAGTAKSGTDLLDSAGTATTIDWSLSGTLSAGNWTDKTDIKMLQSCFYQSDSTARTLTISGLDSSKTYDLYIASFDQNKWNLSSTITFSTANTTTTSGDQVASSTLGTPWTLNDNYVLFEGIVPDGLNKIAISGVRTDGDHVMWSGFQLREVVVPDLDPPSAGTLTPTNGAIDVGIANNFTISFSEEVQAGTGSILIKESDGTLHESVDVTDTGKVTFDTTNVTINIDTDLSLSTEYYILVTNGVIEDLAGNPFAGLTNTTDWAFTTLAALPPPGVTTAGGATEIGAGTASLRAELTNGVAADVYICWGADAGDTSSTSSWENVVSMGSCSEGEVVTNAVSGLYYGVQYSYVVYATNDVDSAWSGVANFTTASPFWTPADMVTEAWFDAADTGTVQTSVGVVTNWNDKSGKGRNATGAGTAQPAYVANAQNGLSAIDFDGSNDALLIGGTAFTTRHVFAVLNAEDGATFAGWNWAFGSSTSTKVPALYGRDTDSVIRSEIPEQGELSSAVYVNGVSTKDFSPLSAFKVVSCLGSSASPSRSDWLIGDG